MHRNYDRPDPFQILVGAGGRYASAFVDHSGCRLCGRPALVEAFTIEERAARADAAWSIHHAEVLARAFTDRAQR